MHAPTTAGPAIEAAVAPCTEADFAARWRRPADPPAVAACAGCDRKLAGRFGWCSGCRLAFCFPCGRGHFCRPSCPANGCHAGLCVREVRDGVLSDRWGLPPD